MFEFTIHVMAHKALFVMAVRFPLAKKSALKTVIHNLLTCSYSITSNKLQIKVQ